MTDIIGAVLTGESIGGMAHQVAERLHDLNDSDAARAFIHKVF